MDVLNLIIFCVSLGALMWSADRLVQETVGVSLRFGTPPILAGFTLIAFSTSIPELVVCLNAGLRGADALAVGNIVGSNVANTLLVLSVPAIFLPLAITDRKVHGDMLVMFGAMVIFALLTYTGSTIDRWEGIVLIAALGGLTYIFYTQVVLRRGAGFISRDALAESADETAHHPLWRTALFIAVGIVMVPASAHFAVESGLVLASDLGVGEELIGLFAIAIGTSLPELATSIAAARRNEASLAVGNVVGSNFFNSLLIAGATASVVPLSVPARILHIDLWVMLVASLALIPFVIGRQRVGRLWGTLMLIAYGAYTLHAWSG